jgi:type I restriction enzyme S subunit
MVKSQFIEMLDAKHETKTLSAVSTYLSKGITPKYVDFSDVNVVNQSCVQWNGISLEYVKYHNSSVPITKPSLHNGDVLLNATGRGTLGRSCIFTCPSSDKTYINDGHVLVIRTDHNVMLPQVLVSYFALNDTQGEIYRDYVTGSTNQIDIVFTDLKKMTIPVPPIEKQKEFVSIYRQADKSKFELRKSIEAIDKVIKSLINN